MAFGTEQFVYKTRKLLDIERETEIDETRILQENLPPKELQRRGVCLLRLRIASQQTGLYGRRLLVFERQWPGEDLPSHNFTPGDIAGLALTQSADGPRQQIASGIVSRVSPTSISVAYEENFDQLEINDSSLYNLMKLANDITYKRLKECLDQLNKYISGPSGQLINVLFGENSPSLPTNSQQNDQAPALTLFNPNLDASQCEAVQFALEQKELAIIHGPPGTGKTTTVIEIIRQSVKQKLKVLACAPSNIAVDNLVERLAQSNTKVVRLGHPARLLPTIQKHSLDAILSASDETELVKDVRLDMDKALNSMKKCRDKGKRHHWREEIKTLRKELRERESAAIQGILTRAEVVLCTLTSATDKGPLKQLQEGHFDLVVIDECSQAMEVACWMALLKGRRCILAGDHNQLPPTILSHKAAADGLAVTLMERLLKLHGEQVMRMLTTQYRMHRLIMTWSSEQLYGGKLVADASVAEHLLRDLPDVADNEYTSIPLLLMDTAGCDLRELNVPDEMSKGNEGEADLVAHHVKQLVESGLPQQEIAVIAPYNLQVELLRIRLSQKYPRLEIKSVDGFQGREKEAVIISLVRSNEKGEVGFLAENRRINVAITRARRHLVVVCDSETVGHHQFLSSLVEYMGEYGEVRSAQQVIEDGADMMTSERPAYVQEQIEFSSTRVASTKTSSHAQKPGKRTKQDGKRTKMEHFVKKDMLKTSTPNSGVKGFQQDDDENYPEASIEEIIHTFSQSNDAEYVFPTTLNSRQRFLVHEIAEKCGLQHTSVGEGQQRQIIVSKGERTMSVPTTASQEKSEKPPLEHVKEDVKGSKKTVTTAENTKITASDGHKCCQICSQQVPLKNFDLHQLRCKPPTQSSNQDASKLTNPPIKDGAKPKSGKEKKKKTAKSVKPKAVEEDFDILIAEAIKENSECHFKKCKTLVVTMGQNCQYCAKRFCLSHYIPEGHGCGDKAKERGRAQICRDGVLYRGSGVPNKKPDPVKRAHLERKLDSKLNKLAEKRQTKKKDDN